VNNPAIRSHPSLSRLLLARLLILLIQL